MTSILHIMQTDWLPRFLFLCFTFGLLFSCSGIVHNFEDVIKNNIQLSFFLSLVVGHAGNCGSQTVSTVVRLCRTERISLQVIVKETLLSALSTVILVFLFIIIAYLANFHKKVIFVTSSTLLIMSPFASYIGSLSCYIIQILQRDPAIYAGPIVTTFVDLVGVLCYIGIAQLTFS